MLEAAAATQSIQQAQVLIGARTAALRRALEVDLVEL